MAKAGNRSSGLQSRKNQIIFSQDDSADAVFYIEKSLLKITIHSRQGRKAVAALLGAGDFLGEECLTERTRRIGTAAMMTSGSIIRIEKATLLHLLHSEPRFAELFVSYLADRNFRLEHDLADQLLNSSAIFRINQDTLAAMVGTTQSHISFFMNKFRLAGFIHYDGDDLTVDSSLSAFVHE